MAKWTFSEQRGQLGRFQVVISAPGGRQVDVSYFRGVPVQLDSYSFGDPFSDASAVLSFPQISGFDDLHSSDVGSWCKDFANVDIYWLPFTPGTAEIDPRTNQLTAAVIRGTARELVWEGFVASMDLSEGGLSLQCQGALYQLDRYLAKPFFPPRPIPNEALIAQMFDPASKPHLRTQPLATRWPAGWSKKAPSVNPKALEAVLVPMAKPGSPYTGYATRQTGNWDRALTQFIQDLLSVMFVDDESGVTPGNQWTVLKEPVRKPVLQVRDRFRAPDFELWYGQIGVDGSFSRDTTQVANIVFGEGTDVAGTTWRNAVISSDGSRTDYAPLAFTRAVWPYQRNPILNKSEFAAETFFKYGPGFNQDSAAVSAGKTLSRDADAGWSGDITIKVDPPQMSKWKIRAGMTMLLKGFMGSGETGVRFHVAEVTCKPMDGSVSMRLDTRYRDLLTIEEAVARTRDALTPSKMLQVNRRSALVEDAAAPWDYTAGSGFMPRSSLAFHRSRPGDETFPWTNWLRRYPPLAYGQYYVKVNADKPSRYERWSIPIPIVVSQAGTIRRVEVVACDIEGNIIPVPFHFSLYKIRYTPQEMPRDRYGPSPWIPGAYESVQSNGLPWPTGNFFNPPPHMIIGWGNAAQPAGYSPGRYSDGNPPTGLLVDEGSFQFNTGTGENTDFDMHAAPGERQDVSGYTIYGALYAEWPTPVYFMGRLYRAEPGT